MRATKRGRRPRRMAPARRPTHPCLYMAEGGWGSSPISRVLSNGSGVYRAAGQSFLLAPCYHDAPAAYPGAARATPWLPYLALPRMGFAVPVLLPVPRWALTRTRLRALRNHANPRFRTVSPLPDPAGAAFAAPAAAAHAAASLRAETRSLLFRRQASSSGGQPPLQEGSLLFRRQASSLGGKPPL